MRSVIITLSLILVMATIKPDAPALPEVGQLRRYIQGSNINALITDAKYLHVVSAGSNIKDRMTVKNIVIKEKALAGINASYFSMVDGQPFGLLIKENKLYIGNIYSRPVLLINYDNSAIITTPIIKETPMKNVKYAVGGGSSLVRNSKIFVTSEHFSNSFVKQHTNRTAVGITKNGKVILAVVSNANLYKLAKIMYYLGCVDAINLDGGGSSQMFLNGKHIMYSDRPVPVAIIIN